MKNTNYLFLKIFLGLCLFWVIITNILTIGYETNDDPVMLLIASGYFTGSPDPHLIFSNTIYGYFLSSLYSFAPTIEWYTVLLVLAQLISLSTIIFLFLKYENLNRILLSALILLSCYFILILQFTTTAFLLASAGLLLLYFVFQNESQFSYFQLVASLGLILWAFLLRADVFYVSATVSALFFIKFLKSKKLWITAFSLFSVLILVSIIHKNSYQNEEYKQYFKFNLLRSQLNIYDNPNVKNIDIQKFVKNNPEFTEDEVRLFIEEVTLTKPFSFEKVQQLHQYLPKTNLINILEIKKLIVAHPFLWVFISILILMTLFSKMYGYAFAILVFLSLCITISSIYVLKARVLLGLFFVLMTFLTFGLDKNNMKNSLMLQTISFSFLFLSIFYPTKYILQLQPQYELMNVNAKELKSDGIYINRRAIQLGQMNPFMISNFMKDKKMLFLGWLNHSPLQNKQFRNYFNTNNIDLFEDLIIHSKENVYFIGEVTERLQRYLNKYHIQIKKIPHSKSPVYSIVVSENQ